ncbi:hypothetical protein NF556_05435 [Ornithinimicrobium faecis]|uniref:Uncharacterized protein n=1 Tax=Ornithinimicrobium faecis TaxID=2934158 RepID=A0ABY4YWD2_9MICO|nr:hypothetical protein [Ornithinimicrobium sp. HY1793]USQ81088.1 hypothetical protein NF556_05435 [Ornithinimicrobium sp. HY1793]
MTATLLKHEWLRTRSMLAAIAGVAVVLVVLGSVLAATRWPLISTIGAYAVIVTIAALVPAVQLALAADYWRSSYGRAGYFTQTLPVPGPTIFRAKLLWVWTATLGAIVGVLILGALAWPGTARGMGYPELNPFVAFADFWSGLLETVPIWQLIVGLILALALGVLIWPVQYYFAVSIGSEEPLNRLGAGGPVLMWLAVYVGAQLVTLVGLLVVPLGIGAVDGGALGIVSYAPLSELTSSNPQDVMPLGIIPALALVAAALLWRTVRSWRSKVSLV